MKLWRLFELFLALALATGARCQVLSGDTRFPVLNEIRWEMNTDEIRSLCESRQALSSATDSVIVFTALFFGTATTTEIQIDSGTKKPRLIHVKFKEATKAIRDTLYTHFSMTRGKPLGETATEKKALIFTLRIEVAKWKTDKEMIAMTTALRDGTIMDVGFLLYPVAKLSQ